MKKLICYLGSLCILLMYSCSADQSSAELTYTKAIGIYGDLNDQRTQPLLEGIRDLSNPGKVFVSEELLLIGEEEEGIHVYDNSDPENPVALNFIKIPSNKEFYVQDNFIYAESLYDMLKIDISDKSNPILESRIENAFVQEFTNAAGEVLIGFEFQTVTEEVVENSDIWNEIWNNQNVAFFDFQSRLIPKSAVPSSFAGSSGSSIGTVNRIAHSNNHVYVISNQFMTVFEDNDDFQLIGSNYAGWQMETIYPQGNNLFVGTRGSMEIFSITNPKDPILENSFSHANACDPVLPNGNVAYVTLRANEEDDCPGTTNSLLAVDITNTRNTFLLEEIDMISPFGMTIIGNTLYVGEGANGLKTFSISDSNGLLDLLKFDSDVQAYDVIAHPTKADIILIASPSGFGQYQIDSDQNISLLSMITI